MKKALLIIAVLTVLSGCAMTPEEQAKWDQINMMAQNEAVCSSSEECDEKWAMATYFVTRYAQRGIRNSSDNFIDTYPSPQSSLQLHAAVNRVPLGDGRYRIASTWGCGNMFGCSTNPTMMRAAFNEYLRTGVIPE